MEYLFRQKDEYEDSTTMFRFQSDGIIELTIKFREFLLGIGYHPNTVDEYVPDPYKSGDCCPSHELPDSEGGEE
jgi:hypothetical protein